MSGSGGQQQPADWSGAASSRRSLDSLWPRFGPYDGSGRAPSGLSVVIYDEEEGTPDGIGTPTVDGDVRTSSVVRNRESYQS
jgi:hypothetical protein